MRAGIPGSRSWLASRSCLGAVGDLHSIGTALTAQRPRLDISKPGKAGDRRTPSHSKPTSSSQMYIHCLSLPPSCSSNSFFKILPPRLSMPSTMANAPMPLGSSPSDMSGIRPARVRRVGSSTAVFGQFRLQGVYSLLQLRTVRFQILLCSASLHRGGSVRYLAFGADALYRVRGHLSGICRSLGT